MAKLELPIRSFIEDYVKRAFPDRDWSRGSAINDLVIKAYAALIQPLRHEIDVIKVNQSLANWKYMRPADLDALATNWGKFRQTGGVSTGTVRIYFDSAADYTFNSLEFFSTDGSSFILAAPVRITATDLFTRRLSDGTFYFDVVVESIGTGSRYALPAGSIVGVKNKPPGVIRVENPADFEVTAPDESNFDVVNSMYKNIGMRNLVSRQSIRAPLLDNFPGILDLFIAGAGHANMQRDLATVRLATGLAQIHLGGMTDVWLNTRSLSQQQVLISYVPSSLEIKIVSAEQADNSELLFSYARGQYSVDGVFSNPDLDPINLDESASVIFDLQDVPLTSFVIDTVGEARVQVAARDVLSGTELLVLMGQKSIAPYVADLTGLNFANTSVAPDDYILFDGKYRRIARVSGSVLDLAPAIETVHTYLYDESDAPAGTRTLTIADVETLTLVNDRLVVPSSPAAGQYLITAVGTDSISIGRIAGTGKVTYVGVDPDDSNVQVYNFTAPDTTRPLLPPDVGTSHHLYFGTDAGYDQTKYFPIVAITPGTTVTVIKIQDNSLASTVLGADVSVIAGLIGTLPEGTLVTVERDNGALLPSSAVQTFAVGHTLYANVLPADVSAGSQTLESVGIGATAEVGALIEFTGLDVPDTQLSATGGDGSRVSVVITGITDDDTVTFTPALGFDVPANTRFAVIRNDEAIVTVNPTAVDTDNNDFTISAMPGGLGDAIGLLIKDEDGTFYAVTNSTAGNTRKLTFTPPTSVRTLTFTGTYSPAVTSDKGKPVQQVVGATVYNGVLYDFDNASRVWYVAPNGVGDLFDSTSNLVTVVGSTASGILTGAASAEALRGYSAAVIGDLGSIVRQGTFIGTLDAYDNAVYQWRVKPMSEADRFDSTTAVTFVDYDGSGQPQVGHGSGTLSAAAGPAEVGGGTVTLSLNATPAFDVGDDIEFYSRFSRHSGMFDGDYFSVFSGVNTDPFAGVTTNDKLVVLLGDDLGVYDISKVEQYRLIVSGAPLPHPIALPNAPAAQQFDLAVTLPVGTTTIAQTGIGLWAYPGRAISVNVAGTVHLFPVATVNNADSIELAVGLPFPIFPNQGTTWQVVEALNVPFWIVPATAFKSYRVFRVPTLGDLLEASSGGGFTNIGGQQDHFADNTVDFGTSLANADFTNGDYQLFIDSGSEASSTSIKILEVLDANTLRLDATFTVTETGVSYRIVRRNTSVASENWIPATVSSVSPLELTLDVPNDTDFARYGSYFGWTVEIRPEPNGSLPMAWAFDDNWHTGRHTILTYNVGSKVLRLNIAADTFSVEAGDAALEVNQKVRVALRAQDRTSAAQLTGTAVNTFNYYSDKFFQLPVVLINRVEVLDPTSLQPVNTIDYTLRVDDVGLRYSASELNTLVISDPDVALKPLRITYTTDSLVEPVSNYLNAADTRVLNANQLAKRMETFSVSVSMSVRSTLSQSEIASQIASFINSRRSTLKLSKADILKDLLDRSEISYVDLESFTLSGTYYRASGAIETFADSSELFGGETACYLAHNISVTLL